MVNILLATWLFVAAFAFNATTAQFWSVLLVSILVVTIEVLSMWRNDLRFVDTALGLWLIFSVWLLPPRNDFVYWNNIICGLLIAVMSMVRTRVKHRPWVPSRNGYQKANEEDQRWAEAR
ncbi:MAG: SPW repeat protein [Myxococcaceae bacterium]